MICTTTDLAFASYLKQVGYQLIEISYDSSGYCQFTFDVESEDPDRVYAEYLMGASVPAYELMTVFAELKRVAMSRRGSMVPVVRHRRR